MLVNYYNYDVKEQLYLREMLLWNCVCIVVVIGMLWILKANESAIKLQLVDRSEILNTKKKLSCFFGIKGVRNT